MGALIAEVGSILSGLIAASSVGVAVRTWLASRKNVATVTLKLERDGRTYEVSAGDTKDPEEMHRLLTELMENADTSTDEDSPTPPSNKS
ncbi:hypothetical protein OG883_23520 [Streptomyces sp. NBC_01142]|uniref:effector-associated constant component EACC1 n=1 Tax=Streptomyces sp. NBC_01142 TaxID=2975865 RepID=UPI0022519CBA|nr:hypothetical protein [Streptomyces sp. NBC_01142]MCX4822812.1 hypothetical protein [Streptomyces sp. NBC_01142]